VWRSYHRFAAPDGGAEHENDNFEHFVLSSMLGEETFLIKYNTVYERRFMTFFFKKSIKLIIIIKE
jgi:hypothetical protein